MDVFRHFVMILFSGRSNDLLVARVSFTVSWLAIAEPPEEQFVDQSGTSVTCELSL